MAQMEDDAVEIQQLLTLPENEENLYECLGGTFGHNTRLTGYEPGSLDRDGAAVQKTFTDHEVEDYVEPSMLGRSQTVICLTISLHKWRRGKVEVGKDNDHWTEDEMIELVDGVSRKGIGRWSKVKGDYFSTSIRTAVHLKDKWRNLVRACKAKNTSKKKPREGRIDAGAPAVSRLERRSRRCRAREHVKELEEVARRI
ncbi:hypothetical protein C2845_PM02G14100 [Panicum miliaceum]|uniref:Uncharacterized protein n=1 Tax=Panicum miliaceum TaxID=4540 RepID=A0A3L6SB38_PANMI|nr:hypothetical protein C2845_PM02G14100 [Panicum miliaceum]